MTNSQKVGLHVNATLEELELAWEHVRRSLRTEVKDWLALQVYGYPSHTSKYLSFILELLKRGEYRPNDAYPFYIPKKDRSLRRFEFLDMDDRIVFQYLCNRLIRFSFEVIAELHSLQRIYGNIPNHPDLRSMWPFQRPFNLRSNGYILVNGQYDLFRNRVLSSFDEFARQQGQGWLVRTDIRSYYYSVDHGQLLKLIEGHSWLPDEMDRDLLRRCLKKWASAPGKGIPVGYECSDYIGNLYLNCLDETLKDFRVHRYVDDTYILVHDFEQVKDVLFKIDKTLDTLGLQRNTSKTKTYRIPDLSRDELQRMLRQSLSTVADEQQDPVKESKRQERLLAILEESFDPHVASDSFDDSFADFRNVAFVLNRITREEENIKSVAYYVLDHDLEHSYHALKYLTLHAADDRLIKKLKSVLKADYEPRSLKALALYCLQKLGDPDVEDIVRSIVENEGRENWHLIRSAMKQVIEPSLESFPRALLDSAAANENPHVEAYARWLIFEQESDPLARSALATDMLVNDNHYVKELGIYLAHRNGLLDTLDATVLELPLRTLFPDMVLNEIENFRKEFSDVFGIPLAPELPLGDYFGSMSAIAPIMRVMYATKDQGATDFVASLYSFLKILLLHVAAGQRYDANPVNIDDALELLDNDRLYLLVSTLRGELEKEFVKEGIQDELINRFKSSLETWIKEVLHVEVMETQARNQAFICYARADEIWLNTLLEHLQPIEDYRGALDIWSDKKIETGDHWREEIMNALAKAKIAVLLVSRPFLASRFIHKVELPAILKGEKRNELKVIWIPVSPSNVDVTPIFEFQAPWRDPENTLVDMNEGDRERHLVLVTKEIAKHMGMDFNSSTSDSTACDLSEKSSSP